MDYIIMAGVIVIEGLKKVIKMALLGGAIILLLYFPKEAIIAMLILVAVILALSITMRILGIKIEEDEQD